MFENIDLGAILEEKARELVKGLLNFQGCSVLDSKGLSPRLQGILVKKKRSKDTASSHESPSRRDFMLKIC